MPLAVLLEYQTHCHLVLVACSDQRVAQCTTPIKKASVARSAISILNTKEFQCSCQDSRQFTRFSDFCNSNYSKVNDVQRFLQDRQTIRFRPLFPSVTWLAYLRSYCLSGSDRLDTLLLVTVVTLRLLFKMDSSELKIPDYYEAQDSKKEWKTMNTHSLKKKLPPHSSYALNKFLKSS